MRWRWRPSLRTRITITLVVVAVGAAATTAGALVWNARSIILESKQAAIYEVLRFEATAATVQLSPSPDGRELAQAAEMFSVPVVLINMKTGAYGGSLPIDAIPEYLLDTLSGGEDISAYERTSRSNRLEFIAGLSLVSVPAASDGLAAFGLYDMQEQQDEIDALVSLGVLIGVIFTVAAAATGLLVGRQLGRPLQTLATVADGLGDRGRPRVAATGYPDVDAVLDAMHHSEQRVDTTIDQLERSEATARQLVADVAHELRTPLATLVAVSDILADTEAATVANRQEAGSIAARSATHLASLTNDILEMSRFDSGKSEVVRQPVDIAEMWLQLAELRQWDGVTFTLEGGPVVHTDAVRLRLILSNLVTNALRHGAPPVDVRVWVQEGRLTIAVADSGPGIEPEHEERVFNRFYKANSARTNSDSSGLGLAIVRENARILGGDAWLTQEHGTVFAVWVPILT